MRKHSIRTIIACAVVGLIAACGQDKADDSVTTNAEPSPAPESFARSAVDAGGVERIKVKASGKGENIQVAVDRAIRLAFEQVNGKAFDAATASLDSRFTTKLGDMSWDGSVTGYADAIFSATSGSVSDFRILSQQDVNGQVEVLIEASVEQFRKPESAPQLRIALSPFRTDSSSFSVGGQSVSAADVAGQINNLISESLLGSNRVMVLDREFDNEVRRELSRIDADNWKNEDRMRLGQQLATDFLVVGKIERFEYVKHSKKMRSTDREITSWSGGATLSYQVVNVATGQVVLADSVSTDLPETRPTAMGASVDSGQIIDRLVQGLAKSPRQDIVVALFPITVVDVDGDMVALSQGGEAVEKGKEYNVVVRGKEIKDPQTGQFIGRMERHCCVIQVTNVTKELSYGIVVSKDVADVAAIFKPGALELRNEVERSFSQVTTPKPAPRNITQPKASPLTRVEADDTSAQQSDEDPDW